MPSVKSCEITAIATNKPTAVSVVRQPIESLFNWLIEKTDFQRASKVRSTKGLIVHVFGKIAAAFIYLIF